MEKTRIVILGAGYAGVRTARQLLRSPDRKNFSITLIARQDHHVLMSDLPEAASGRVKAETVRIPLTGIFSDADIRLVQDEIRFVDFANKCLKGEKDSYSFDYLVVAGRARTQYSSVPGAKRFSRTLNSLESARRIQLELSRHPRGRVVICGGDTTAVELAGDIAAMYPRISVTLIQSGEDLVPDLPLYIGRGTREHLEKTGVRVLTETQVIEVREKMVRAATPDLSLELESDLTIWCDGTDPGLRDEFRELSITEPNLRLRRFPFVFVAGEWSGKRPVTVKNSLGQADIIADNIRNSLAGRPLKDFKPVEAGWMVSVGPKYGFTDSRIPLHGWLAAVFKFIAELFYVLRIAGPLQAVRYLSGHLVDVDHGQTIVGSLLSTAGQRLWLFPLRIYLGVLWLTEGWKKIIGSANYNKGQFIDYFRIGPDSWLREGNLMIPFPWLSSADCLTGATISAVPQIPILQDLPFWYEGMMRTIMPTPAIAMFFQILLVWAEFAIGAGLLLGLFTWFSSGISLVLAFNMVLAGAGGWEMSWIIPASIALMAGAGRFLGLDQFVLPWFKKHFLLE